MLLSLLLAAFAAAETYKNTNPRPYDNCEAADLIKLSACCNDVLADLDDCKAGDLACECCALQSMDRACYSLCPGNPLTNFLAVLFADCSALNDVNACNIPFKKADGEPEPYGQPREPVLLSVQLVLVAVAAVPETGPETGSEPDLAREKPKLRISYGPGSEGMHQLILDLSLTNNSAVAGAAETGDCGFPRASVCDLGRVGLGGLVSALLCNGLAPYADFYPPRGGAPGFHSFVS